MWKIELLPNQQCTDPAPSEIPFEYQWTKPRYFDTVQVSVTLEAILYEYRLRTAIEKARREHPNEKCVCAHLSLPKEHDQEFWPSEIGYEKS
jgi:hypothetical protein